LKKIFFYSLLLLGCNKKHDPLFGLINISGRITDIVSGEPIPNAFVYLQVVELRPNLIGGYAPIVTNTAITDSSDVNGYYDLSIVANGEYDFQLYVDPRNPYYVNSNYTIGQNQQRVVTIGNHIMNQPCNRSAYAKVIIKNVPPIDTPYFLSLSAIDDGLTLNHFYKDTLVYLKLAGRSAYPNSVRFNKNNEQDNTYQITANPWDTVLMQFNY